MGSDDDYDADADTDDASKINNIYAGSYSAII